MPTTIQFIWCELQRRGGVDQSNRAARVSWLSGLRPQSLEDVLARGTAQREHGIEVEVIDLRCLSPYDWEAVAATVRKTSRVIVAYEDTRSWGYGAEIAARIGDELFDHLDAPVRRVAAKDTFCGYHPKLEDAILPQSDTVIAAVKKLVEY